MIPLTDATDGTFVAFVRGPTGLIWASTVAVYDGIGAELKAAHFAKIKFYGEITSGLIKGDPPAGFFPAAKRSGFECVTLDITEQLLATKSSEAPDG